MKNTFSFVICMLGLGRNLSYCSSSNGDAEWSKELHNNNAEISSTSVTFIRTSNDSDNQKECSIKGTPSINIDDITTDKEQRLQHPPQLRLYLAESSIPGAGIGIYTSIDLKEGDFIGEGEQLIPITSWIVGPDDWLVHDIQWDTRFDPRLTYDSIDIPSIFFPGFGTQINCHMGLNNIRYDHLKYDSEYLHRRSDPGVGAFTPWHGLKAVATRDIQAGEELFVDYGEGWFDGRVDILGEIPFLEDYKAADIIMERFIKSPQHDLLKSVSDKDEVQKESWEKIVAEQWRKKVQMALPKSYEDLKEAHEVGSARYSIGGKASLRTQKWLDKNAFCIDNLYMQASKIHQAGRGVFTKHYIASESIISPFPVLQLDKHIFAVDESYKGNTSDYELLTNYAFAHSGSNVVLLPYTALVNGINHDGLNPNAELRWSESNLNRKDYLEVNGEEVLKQGFGLLMELVALRNLQPDEKVLISYGDEWEEAWTNHTNLWKATQDSDEYISAADTLHRNGGILLIESEQQKNPYPSNIMTMCNFIGTEDTYYYELPEETSLLVTWEEKNNACMRNCKILSRYVESNRTYYDVEIIQQEDNLGEECYHPTDERLFVDKVPQHAVTLVDQVFTSDIHLANAFRHFIGLPSHLLPEAWKDSEE